MSGGEAADRAFAESLYDGALGEGWQDWGWGQHDLGKGGARIKMNDFGGFILAHAQLPSRFAALVFKVRSSAPVTSFLRVAVAGDQSTGAFPDVDVSADMTTTADDGSVEVVIPWSTLDPAGLPFQRISFHARTAIGTEWVVLDHIGLSAMGDGGAGRQATRNVTLSIDCAAPDHPISPLIYGVAGIDDWEVGATARRWGGNPTTRYNWRLNTYNLANDWYFENVFASEEPSVYQTFLEQDRTHGLRTAITLPIIGWVAKDATSSGFPVAAFGAQQHVDPNRQSAGNGHRASGAPLTPGAPTETSMPAPPEFVGSWVTAIRHTEEQAGARTVSMYMLDNEPALWNSTHRDVHPNPVDYGELLDRTVRYGRAVRAADPEALIAGPAEWGWTAYFDSAKDAAMNLQLRPDRRAHGDIPLIPWYLQQLAAYQKRTGTQILDVLDVHFYPQGENIYGGAADAATAARRLRSTRALWDPSYKDESWIDDTVRLIPRLKEWVNQYYPGLRISIGEYNFGGEQHMSGALALAEALGHFGTEGIFSAFYWTMPPAHSPCYWAFRTFRNFDGKGGHFLDRSLVTKGGRDVSLFASRDASGKHLVAIALNEDPAIGRRANVVVAGGGRVHSAHRYTFDADDTAIVDRGTQADLSAVALPPYSITVLDVTLE